MSTLNLSERERVELPLELVKKLMFRVSMDMTDYYKPLMRELYKLHELGIPYERIEQAISNIAMSWLDHQSYSMNQMMMLLRKEEND